jgi:membrane protein required for colicin V production
MTAFDYVVITVLLASLLLGLWRGVVGEMVSLAAWVLAFLAAREWGDEVGHRLYAGHLTDSGWQVIAGWVTLFIAVLLLMALLRPALRGLLKALGLGLTDRLLGIIFGLLRGVLIVLILVAAGGLTSAPKQAWWLNAHFSPPLETAVLAAKPWLPTDLAKRIRFR